MKIGRKLTIGHEPALGEPTGDEITGTHMNRDEL
jgi:hypothetical protein